jgi:hypothetical protein
MRGLKGKTLQNQAWMTVGASTGQFDEEWDYEYYSFCE